MARDAGGDGLGLGQSIPAGERVTGATAGHRHYRPAAHLRITDPHHFVDWYPAADGSPAAPLLVALAAELMGLGYATELPYYANQPVFALCRWEQPQAPIVVMHYCIQDVSTVYLVLAGTRPAQRRRGHYRCCWGYFLREVRVRHPEVRRVRGMYHALNRGSDLAHAAVGAVTVAHVFEQSVAPE